MLDVDPLLQRPRVGAQAQKQVSHIRRERDRRYVEKDAEQVGVCHGASMELEIRVLKGARPLGHRHGKQARDERVHRRQHGDDQSAVRIEAADGALPIRVCRDPSEAIE